MLFFKDLKELNLLLNTNMMDSEGRFIMIVKELKKDKIATFILVT